MDQTTFDRLYAEAKEALIAGDAVMAAAPITALVAAAPDHAMVKAFARLRAVMAVTVPIERVHYVPASIMAPDQAQIDLVAFHADVPAQQRGTARHDYLGVLKLAFESAQLRAPRARRILLTDECTELPADLGADEVMRFPLDTNWLMYERMRVQQLYLERRRSGACSVLMDSDVVVNRDPAPVFATQFDVGMTWRPRFNEGGPINGGMIFVHASPAGAAFFKRALQAYWSLAAEPALQQLFSADLRTWWGDQYALARLAGFAEVAQNHDSGLVVDGTRLQFFHCDDYNFSIKPDVEYPPDFLSGRYFVHFKGNLKSMQAQYLAAMRTGQV